MFSTMPSSKVSDVSVIENLRITELEPIPVLSPELARCAERELNETPERKSECLETLRQLLLNEENLRSRIDTAFLLRFLRPAKFDPQRACKMIKRYYKLRLDSPSVFTNAFTPKDQAETFTHNLVTVLPHKDEEGRTLFMVRAGEWDPTKLPKDDFFMSTLLMMELSIRDVQTLIKGTVVIIDMKGFSMSHLTNLTPTDLRRMVSMIQDCFPCRIKAIHIVNQPRIFSFIWNIIRHLLSSKMSKRMHLHGYNLSNFHEYVNPKLLPDILGGTEPFDNSSRAKELIATSHTYYQDAAYGYTDYTKDYIPRK